jgi:predicted DNA-binding transcriptional regulator AlpA
VITIKQHNTLVPDRVVREPERKFITGVGRTQAWVLEKEGAFPKRRLLNPNGGTSVCWLYSELIEFCHSREVVSTGETP